MKDIKIICDNERFVVCIKPQNVTSEDGKTVGMPSLLQDGNIKPFVVHRLDKEVSGVMVFAKTSDAAARLSRQITDNSFEKEYLAIVQGDCGEEGVFEDFLYHDRQKNKTYVVKRERKGVKSAKLQFWRLATAKTEDGVVSLVKVKLYTGRTHQIRVQFASRKMPLLGDRKYGSQINCPIALFSHRVSFFDKGSLVSFEETPPKVFPWDLF